jgi:hypothetical protein
MEIKITADSVDGIHWNRTYKTIVGARAFLDERIGENPETGHDYLVSPDGIVRASVSGIAIAELYAAGTPEVEQWECNAGEEAETCGNAGCEPCRQYEKDIHEGERRGELAADAHFLGHDRPNYDHEAEERYLGGF